MTDPRPPTPRFTPALGFRSLTAAYDLAIALATREGIWRRRMLAALTATPGQTVVDIGAGTGSFALMLARQRPGVRIVAIDPDPAVRAIAERKFARAGIAIDYVTAGGEDAPAAITPGSIDWVTISLVLHQCPQAVKQAILHNAFALLREGGRLLISDYGVQRGPRARLGFQLVRLLDGFENTRANMAGMLPTIMKAAGFAEVREEIATPTPSGDISLYSGMKGRHRREG
ncbi:class I SAM-dependent methyltransferase [Zavarzinia compransoris]|uniref:class I SAM-dependent methyltransferase n=1 Tax=Zavarzinia marina TaxID=2911065 RepID=UPI001F447E24|nr:methyltransferase domain-containing protein [Zavarzinia marina]MCF4165077.1 class I SAM-dependent methyltransferase [Zavarzinia marina]